MFSIHTIAIGALGQGLSGGDRIFIELTRRWSKNRPVHIYVWEEGYEMTQREKLRESNIDFHITKVGRLKKLGFVFTYIYRIYLGIKLGLTLNLDKDTRHIIYSASEFWMDSIPAFLIAKRHKNARWVAAWYQTAPNPITGFSEVGEGGRYRFSAFLYWLVQKPIKPLVSKFADLVLVNNQEEKKLFPELDKEDRVEIVFGAVDLAKIKGYMLKHKPPKSKKFAGVFQGRFHPQKGVVELIDIWKKVVDEKPKAKLAMIGDGPLMDRVVARIKYHELRDNVKLFGYVSDGPLKYKVFSNSKVVLHPAFYDSGGMASAEAMAFGLPCVGYNLASYRSYYPKGMLKVKKGSKQAFAEAVIKLLEDKEKYNKFAKESEELIQESWSWDTRAKELLKKFKDIV